MRVPGWQVSTHAKGICSVHRTIRLSPNASLRFLSTTLCFARSYGVQLRTLFFLACASSCWLSPLRGDVSCCDDMVQCSSDQCIALLIASHRTLSMSRDPAVSVAKGGGQSCGDGPCFPEARVVPSACTLSFRFVHSSTNFQSL